MSRILSISITPKTVTTTNKTCIWQRRTVFTWGTTITSSCADRLRAMLTGRTPDAWHLENIEADEWEFIDEDVEEAIALMAEDTQLPDLNIERPDGCEDIDTLTVLIN
ncbi:MAG: hypothetical protein L0L66_07745 [Bifidobacterium crudilactis]|uniref:hypothetical protein n=1 Tax=Bifidobacterium crudilactis TaxID=327277 RepID=UPI002647464A|nr:hypothetical protein [Bifidobacterium crudilactis]MDN6210415.1 hypothetical protein [Bifidobacterium crudilactis]MDN6817301.1 hypothetical protein [Bifidobacterium crudilactis]MDN6854603.1 hypothetical protein [Bifidobacterium crudilactis]